MQVTLVRLRAGRCRESASAIGPGSRSRCSLVRGDSWGKAPAEKRSLCREVASRGSRDCRQAPCRRPWAPDRARSRSLVRGDSWGEGAGGEAVPLPGGTVTGACVNGGRLRAVGPGSRRARAGRSLGRDADLRGRRRRRNVPVAALTAAQRHRRGCRSKAKTRRVTAPPSGPAGPLSGRTSASQRQGQS